MIREYKQPNKAKQKIRKIKRKTMIKIVFKQFKNTTIIQIYFMDKSKISPIKAIKISVKSIKKIADRNTIMH